MKTLREAAEKVISSFRSYQLTLEHVIVLDELKQALEQRQECESCAAKRRVLIDAGILKPSLRDDRGQKNLCDND